MGFLNALANQISSQYSIGENNNNSLDIALDDKNVQYGALGQFADKFDRSSQRRYVEEGYLRRDPYNASPKQLEILTQQPDATLLIKKRMFSTIAENFRPDYMDADEKLYYRCIKILFQNKCNQIANLEKLSKIQKITSIIGEVDNYMIPLILSLTDSFSEDFSSNSIFGSDGKNLVSVVDRLRKIYSYNLSSPHTNWVVDSNNLLKSKYAQGTGVIEITNFSSFDTNIGVELGSGSANITIQDPYQMMLITEYDIERAIADATNLFYNSKTYQLSKESSETLINEVQSKLNKYRRDRGASPISFKVNPDTLLGKRVVAIIDRQGLSIPFTYDGLGSLFSLGFSGGENVGVSVSEDYLYRGNSTAIGIDGLDARKKSFGFTNGQNEDGLGYTGKKHTGMDSELTLFCKLIKAIFDRLTLIANSENSFQMTNKKTNYSRKKLVFNFLGKKIVQPMDSVHIYINSRTKYDNSILGGLNISFNGFGFLQKTIKGFSDLKNSFTSLFYPERNLNMQVEKAAFVGREFPNYLWNSMRSQFVDEKEGVHVFGGIVAQTTDSWSQGSYNVNVTCKDNSTYFDFGKVNFKPGVDVYNGSIFDPLTPFKSNFDQVRTNYSSEIPDLLNENKALMSIDIKDKSPLVKTKQGYSVGLPLTENSIVQDKSIDNRTGLLTRTLYMPDGFVYKWKEGIGVHVQYGSSENINDNDKVGIVNIQSEPFDGLDIMNVISLLITGIPYNFATYWKAVKSNNYSADSKSNEPAAKSFYDSLSETLQKNNLLWGNFIPFKSLTIDDQIAKRMQMQKSIEQYNNDLNNKLQELNDVQNKMSIYGIVDILNPENKDTLISPQKTVLEGTADKLKEEINGIIASLDKEDQSYYTLIGDDVIYDVSNDFDNDITFKPNKTDENESTKTEYRKILRRKVNYLSRRMSYNVRANQDKNLFIVDDQYDKDYDILAYNQALTNIKLFDNHFVSVKDKIKNTAQLLNLEVFCDTQGHIRARPPQYNRMPSSVFYKLMYMKDALGIQLFPDFLKGLFENTINTIQTQVEITEDYIRFLCSLVGYENDDAVYSFIRSWSSKNGEGDAFQFVSNSDGNISNIGDIVKVANPDQINDFPTINNIQNQAKTRKDVFKSSDRAKALVTVLTTKKLNNAGFGINEIDKVKENDRTKDLINRINDKSRANLNLNDYLLSTNVSLSEVSFQNYAVDVFKVFSELATKISDRQKLVKSLYANIKNYKEYRTLDDGKNISNNFFSAGNYTSTKIPEVLESMIEDESYDDLGPGSGQRYIIKNSQIRNLSVTEQPPSMTCVEVTGQLRYLPNATSSFTSFANDGNALTTATALDYDMWRNYGMLSQAPINVPFLQDPVTQCGPYAAMLLSRARKEIFSGTIEIIGNEYMQPGDVIYLENRNMLFYVNAVRHNFAMGSSFTTSLNLTYGHSPGEFIPTTLDIIGKMIYSNRDSGALVINRQTSSFNEVPLGVIIKDKDSSLSKFSTDNIQTINNILYYVQYYINTHKDVSNKKVNKIQIRIYHDSDNAADSEIKILAEALKKTLKGQMDLGEDTGYNLSMKANTVSYVNDKDVLSIEEVNMSDTEDPRSPSQKAINAARDMVDSKPLQFAKTKDPNTGVTQVEVINEKNKLRKALFQYIIDCWLVFENT